MKKRTKIVSATLFVGACLFVTNTALAHCDTMDGPVVVQARMAIESKDISPVLKWVQPEHEAELKTAFARTLAVRPESNAARDLADQFFFETLVRLHRQGEGAPYTGVKPAGTEVEPAIHAADKALEGGKIEGLLKTISEEAVEGIRKRFADASEKKRHAEHNVAGGREYVAAYVEFVHYVEALHAVATRATAGHGHAETAVQTGADAAHAHNH